MKALEFYAQIATKPQLLAQGNKIIAEYLRQSQQNRQQTLLNIFHPTIPVLTLVSTTYAFQIFHQLTKQQKASTRQYLIRSLSQSVNTMSNKPTNKQKQKLDSLIIFINRIHSQDGYDNWIDLYQKIISVNPNKCSIWLLKIFRNSDDRIYPLSKDILKQLIQGNITMEQDQTIQLMYFCIKSLTHLSDADPQLFNQALNPYIDNIIIYSMQKCQSSPKIMTYCFKILTVLLSDLDLQPTEELQGSLTVKKFLQNISHTICIQYLKQLSNRQQISRSIDQQQQDDNNYSINIIMYQFLQLLQTCISYLQQNTLMIAALVATLADFASVSFWKKNQQIYFIQLQDEGLRTIRNKGIELIVSLFDNKPKNAKRFYGLYIWSAIKNSIESPQNNRIITQFFMENKIDFINVPESILEESACYILYSFTQEILQDKNSKSECIKTLNTRIQSSTNILSKIISILIMNKLLRSYPTNSNAQILEYVAQLVKIASNQIKNIGIMLAICRGIGIAAFKADLKIGQTIPKQIILIFLQYITSTQAISPDSAYVVLQTVTKLAEINEANCVFIKENVTMEGFHIILKSYMHDGITGSIVVSLFGLIGNQQIFGQIWKALLNGQRVSCTEDMLIDLIVIAIKNKKIVPSDMDIQSLLRKYSKNNTEMSKIEKIIKQLFNNNQILTFDKLTIQLLNNYPQNSWIIYMLRNKILYNLQGLFWKAINAACYEIISPFQFQCNLILPYYLFIYNSEETLKLLAQKQGIYESFFNQLYKFAQLFTGDSLRVITSYVLLIFAKVDSSVQRKMKIVNLLEKYSQKPIDQWQDEEDDYEDAIDKFLSKRMDNEVAEEAMRLGFPQLAWNTKRLQTQLNALKISLIS